MKKDRDCMNMYQGMMPYNNMVMPNMMMSYNNMAMPNMIPMPTINNTNTYENQLNNLNNRVSILEKRVAKLEGSNTATPYDSNYYMV